MLRLPILLLLLSALAASPVTASPLRFHGYELASLGSASAGGMVAGDFDRDGIDDLAVASTSQLGVIAIVSGANHDWQVRQVMTITQLQHPSPRLLTWKRPDGDALVAVARHDWWSGVQSTAIIYSGRPLRETFRFALQSYVRGSWIGDVDADGAVELVVASTDDIRYYDPETGLFEVVSPYGGEDVIAAQFDSDAALEIVLASMPGRVIDGATWATEWTYGDGFGSYLGAGRFGVDGSLQIVAARDWSIMTIFGAQPWSPLWDLKRFDIDAIAVADFDGDGRDEIVQADGQWGSVNIIDTATRQVQLEVQHDGHGMAAVVAADFTGDGTMQVAYAPRSTYGETSVGVFQPPGVELEYTLSGHAGATGAVAIADVDGDGRRELVTTLNQSPGRVRVIDHATGALENEFTGQSWSSNDPFYAANRFVRVAQLDADPALELVLAGNSFDGRIAVVDGVSGMVQLQVGDYTSSEFSSRTITGAELVDFDRDGILDIVVSTQANSTGTSGVRLQVHSLLTGQRLWESVAMGTGFAPSHGVVVVPGANGGSDTLVAGLSSGLRAYDSMSRLLVWEYAGDVDTFAYLPDAEGGPQLVVASSTGRVQHLDASTRQVVRDYPMPSPVTSISALSGDSRALIVANGTVHLIDPVTLQDHALEQYGVGSLPEHGSVAVVATHAGFDVVAGTEFGWARFSVTPEAVLFRDGFEP